jgi:hypothetical protein
LIGSALRRLGSEQVPNLKRPVIGLSEAQKAVMITAWSGWWRFARNRDNRIPIALHCDLPPFLLQDVSLLVNPGTLGLDLTMQFDVFGAALGIGFDQFIGGLEHLAAVGFNQSVLFRLALCALTGQFDQPLVARTTADSDQSDRQRRPNRGQSGGLSHASFSTRSIVETTVAGGHDEAGPLESTGPESPAAAANKWPGQLQPFVFSAHAFLNHSKRKNPRFALTARPAGNTIHFLTLTLFLSL